MRPVKYILFDAANTLIHKPGLWKELQSVFKKYQISVPEEKLKYHHKMLSEYMDFPDRTSEEFYLTFNRELFCSLGIVPDDDMLADIFSACNYLPWEACEDTACLKDIYVPMGILSNFNASLSVHVEKIFGNIFSDVFVSETLLKRKPHPAFYEHAVSAIGLDPQEILYIGDSFKLDTLPALNVGMRTLLIDRVGVYEASSFRITNLEAIKDHIDY